MANVTYLSKEIIINGGISINSIELVIAFCRHVSKLSCLHDTDMAFNKPTLGNVADMVCDVSVTQSRHAGMYVVLGGKIPDTTPTFSAKSKGNQVRKLGCQI